MMYQWNFRKLNHVNVRCQLFLGVSIVGLILGFASASDKPYADIIFWNGKIITVDQNFSLAEAIAIRNGEILAVGKNKDIFYLRDDSTRVIDLKGHAVIPGLIEGHAHPIDASQSERFEKIPDLHSITELLEWIKDETNIKKKRGMDHSSEIFYHKAQ